MKMVQIILMLIGFQVSSVYGASPEFYGIYANNDNKLIEMAKDDKNITLYEFGQKVQFLVFQKQAELYANGLTIERTIFVRTVNNPGLGGRQPPEKVNTWKSRRDGSVATRTKPVAGQPEQIYVVPRTPLPVGVYIVKSGGREVGKFYVNKTRVTQDLEHGKDCVDIVVAGGWASQTFDLGGGGGKEVPCFAADEERRAVTAAKQFTFIGNFGGDDANCVGNSCKYRVELWRDTVAGIIGQFGYPVQEADTPRRLIDRVEYNPSSGSLSFQAVFSEEDRFEFKGKLTADTLKGTLIKTYKITTRGIIASNSESVSLRLGEDHWNGGSYKNITEWKNHHSTPILQFNIDKDCQRQLESKGKCKVSETIEAKLSKAQGIVERLKLALAMYYREQGTFLHLANPWTSLGMTGPTTTSEVTAVNMTACTVTPCDGTAAAKANTIVLTLGGIKAGSIDGNTITMTPVVGATNMTWVNTCTLVAPGTSIDPVMKKYFNCP